MNIYQTTTSYLLVYVYVHIIPANNRPYTPEQESGAARIVMASKKCYYEVGITA